MRLKIRNSILSITLLTILLGIIGIVFCNVNVVNTAKVIEKPYYTKVMYIDYVVLEKTIALTPGMKYSIENSLPPSNEYRHYVTIVEIEKPSINLHVACDKECMFEKDLTGAIKKIYSFGNRIELSNIGDEIIKTKLKIYYYFIKEQYVELNNESTVINLKIPDETFDRVDNQIIKLVIDNNIPYVISSIYLPNGTELSKVMTLNSEEIENLGIKVEPKELEIDCGKAIHGVYKVIIKKGNEYILPNVFLVKGTQLINTTVEASSVKVISPTLFGIPSGWKLLGYVVAIAAIQPYLIKVESTKVSIIAKHVVPVTTKSGIVKAIGLSYLIPPLLRFKYVVGIYIIYDPVFKIVNNLSMPITLIYIPIVYKEVGKWTKLGNEICIEAEIRSIDVVTGLWTALVVQLPEIAYIEKIVTPKGLEFSNLVESEVLWGSIPRPLSISPDRHEAYITVHVLDTKEIGKYYIYVRLKPLRIQVVDKNGKGLSNILVIVTYDGLSKVAKTNINGIAEIKLDKLPEKDIILEIYYKDYKVKTIILHQLIDDFVKIKIGMYNVTILFTGITGQAISNAEIILRSLDGKIEYRGFTDESGIVKFTNVIEGTYMIIAKYKGLQYSKIVNIDDNKFITLKSDILAVLGGQLPITPIHAILAIAALTSIPITAFAITKWKNRRKEEGNEIVSV